MLRRAPCTNASYISGEKKKSNFGTLTSKVHVHLPPFRGLTQPHRQEPSINYRRPRVTARVIRVTGINDQACVPEGLHVRVLQTRQAPGTGAAADERREVVVDRLRLRGIVVVRLCPEGTAGEGPAEEDGLVWLAGSCNGLRDDGPTARGLSPD